MDNVIEKELTCKFCGFSSSMEDFDLDEYGQGFWCNDCEGYNYFNEQERHKFTLILEGKDSKNSKAEKIPVKLNKRLSPLRYPGGKSKLADYLYSKLRKENTDIFAEAFAGGASVGLALLEAKAVNQLALNDLDFGIYSLFSVIKRYPNELIKRLAAFKPTHEEYFKCQDIVLSHYKNTDMIDAAWAMLLVNRLAYSGICKANPLGGKKGSNEDLLQRWNSKELIKRINKINNMKDRITVFNMDACKFIEEMYWKSSTTILVDPPYFKKGKQLYNCYYEKEDHVDLSRTLDTLYMAFSGADIILTYDDEKYIENLYCYPEVEKINRIYSI